jgi:hypothetical protein
MDTGLGQRMDRPGNGWRVARWSVAAALLLLPAVAMQFTAEVNWTPFDFVFAAVLVIGVVVAYEVAVRLSSNLAYRAGVAAALAAAFLLTWANAAVGIIGSENDGANLVFLFVPLFALLAAAIGRFRAAGMARAMWATAVVQALAALVALMLAREHDLHGFVLSGVFVVIWAVSAALFQHAAGQQAS